MQVGNVWMYLKADYRKLIRNCEILPQQVHSQGTHFKYMCHLQAPFGSLELKFPYN